MGHTSKWQFRVPQYGNTVMTHLEANTDIGNLIKKCVAFVDGIRRSVIPSMVGNSPASK